MKPFYDRNGITIFCGDCLEIMPQLDGPFDAIIADWPYGTTACHWDSVIPLEPLWRECKRLSGLAVLFGSQPFISRLIMSNLKWFKYDLIWIKPQGVDPYQSRHRPLNNIEHIAVFGKGKIVFNSQLVSGEPYKIKRDAGGRENKIRTTDFKETITVNAGTRMPVRTLKFNLERGLHPTQKPEPLMAYLIRTYTNPGDIVLDNTMGSGTTLVAAQNEGRRAVGIELDEGYCRIAVERLCQPSFWSLPVESKPENEQGKLW